MPPEMLKYPRTLHLQGSRLEPGDEDLEAVPFATIRGQHLVVEEKLDGANAGISFDPDGSLLLQSRGHHLTGGARERHFALFKTWAHRHRDALWEVLGDRYVMYGEWLYAKHTIFYDALPHYFLEFDVLDRRDGRFLSTAARRRLLAGTPVRSVPVLLEGMPACLEGLTELVDVSLYKTARWRDALRQASLEAGQDPARVAAQTDPAELAEGLYIKVEDGERVLSRYKWVRASFLTSVLDSGSHWLSRPIVPNQLAEGVDLYAEAER